MYVCDLFIFIYRFTSDCSIVVLLSLWLQSVCHVVLLETIRFEHEQNKLGILQFER